MWEGKSWSALRATISEISEWFCGDRHPAKYVWMRGLLVISSVEYTSHFPPSRHLFIWQWGPALITDSSWMRLCMWNAIEIHSLVFLSNVLRLVWSAFVLKFSSSFYPSLFCEKRVMFSVIRRSFLFLSLLWMYLMNFIKEYLDTIKLCQLVLGGLLMLCSLVNWFMIRNNYIISSKKY